MHKMFHPVQTYLWQNFNQNIYPYIKQMSLIYFQYIDNIFVTWKRTKAELMTFLTKLNKMRKMKFDFQLPPSQNVLKKTKIITLIQLDIETYWSECIFTYSIRVPKLSICNGQYERTLTNSLTNSQSLILKSIYI